ncbi:MAG: hypothetical protein MUD16_03180 [Desulfobacterales bacterium]|jgi:hypothetical protein|nr:hypothetical protein [Desulfobacterales bacterium]
MSNPTPRLIGLLGLIVLAASGCQFETAGSVQKSADVARAFEALDVHPGYRYYVLNQENEPYGVAGLGEGFWIRDPAWREVAPGSPTFEKVVGLVKSFPAPGGYTEGFTILDPQRRQIGVWYSSLGAGITVDPDTKQVMISTATPWLGK